MRRLTHWYDPLLTFIIIIALPLTLTAKTSLKHRQNKIVGGTVSQDNAWPWMLGLVENQYSGPLCGASLIHPRWAITAAHCMEDDSGGVVSADHFQIVSGIFDYTNNYESHMHAIKRIISHPDYDNDLIDNDIALLEMTSDIEGIPTLGIYTGDISNLSGMALGWGRISSNGSFSDQLREVSLPVVSFQTCVNSTQYIVTENMFCAGYQEGGKDACQGDSGGPFVIYDNGHWQLAGIVSWGDDGCANPGSYGFFTRVPNYYAFISHYVPLQSSYAQEDINHDGKMDLKDVMIIINYLSDNFSKKRIFHIIK